MYIILYQLIIKLIIKELVFMFNFTVDFKHLEPK